MHPAAMLVVALLILTGFWLAGAVIAVAVCRAAAEGDRSDSRTRLGRLTVARGSGRLVRAGTYPA